MHELAATQAILDISLKHAKERDARAITDVYLVVGELSTMVDDSVQFYWEMIAKDTIAEKATLHFKRVPAEFQCMVCFNKYQPRDGQLSCPYCGSVGARIISGEEFYVDAIDIENR